MVVAYLRGLLKPSLKRGLRSELAEQIVFNAIEAEMLASDMEHQMSLDYATLPLMKEEFVRNSLNQRPLRRLRIDELRKMDIYAFSRSPEYANLAVTTQGRNISIVQLAKVLEDGGLLNLGLEEDEKPRE